MDDFLYSEPAISTAVPALSYAVLGALALALAAIALIAIRR